MREKRKQLEWTKQELLRKGKDLLAQSSHRRNQGWRPYRITSIAKIQELQKSIALLFLTNIQARNCWKKKFFETKKATGPLEETLKNLRQEMETFYNKLVLQLQARESRGKMRRQGRSSLKVSISHFLLTKILQSLHPNTQF